MAADLVVLDPPGVEDKAIFAKSHQYSNGFDLVIVNGKLAVDDGQLTNNRVGSIALEVF